MSKNLTQVFSEVEREKIIQKAHQTLKNPEGEKALNYLHNERHITNDVIDDFIIGYVPERVYFKLPQLAGRIITPLYDLYGNLIAITSRHPKHKKFWHEAFEKSFHLFGLNVSKEFMIQHQQVILVEGEFDVACLHSYGTKTAVAVCGSALQIFQVALIARYCKKIFLAFDRDVNGSGQQAIQRSIDLNKKNLFDMDFIPVRLPIGVDPDDYIIKYGREEFDKLIKKSEKEYYDLPI